MSFVPTGNTVEVQAFLTAKGRKKLFDSLEGGANESFVTRFALGDSDANYDAIDAGFGTLASGTVPSAGEFMPRIRSYVLYRGQYKPSPGLILVNGEYKGEGGHMFEFPIGNETPRTQRYEIETEWPKGSIYGEEYAVSLSFSDQVTGGLGFLAAFAQAFNFTFENRIWTVEYTGNLDPQVRDAILGDETSGKGGLSVIGRIEGRDSQLVTTITIDFVV